MREDSAKKQKSLEKQISQLKGRQDIGYQFLSMPTFYYYYKPYWIAEYYVYEYLAWCLSYTQRDHRS